MKSILIFILFIALVGENVYIYMYPETFCQEVKEKGDDLLNGLKSKTKDAINSEVETKVDSILPTN
ncbi:hypothetical protein OAW23_04495 [Flavobacteriales bacterium]|jgi:hypothetical protein|nr:hypothetical protein [Flavobacteriales bacterium]